MRASLEGRQREMKEHLERLERQQKVRKRPSLSERQRKMRDRIFKTTTEGRFKDKVDKHGPIYPRLGTRCWIWTGVANVKGYGMMQVDGKSRLATHVLWFLRHGYWPLKGRYVCHHCDNPSCLNPKHLYLGTAKSNMRDMYQRGRNNNHNGSENMSELQMTARAQKGGQACLRVHGKAFFQAIARKRHEDARNDAQNVS